MPLHSFDLHGARRLSCPTPASLGRTTRISYLFSSSWGSRLDSGQIHAGPSMRCRVADRFDAVLPIVMDRVSADLRHRFATTTLLSWYRSHQARRLLPFWAHFSAVCMFRYTMVPSALTGADARRWRSSNNYWGSGRDRHYQPGSALERFFTQRLMQGQGQLHDLLLPRHPFVCSEVYAAASAQTAVGAVVRGDRCAVDRGVSSSFGKNRGLSVRNHTPRSFFRYIAYELPTHSAKISAYLPFPSKRFPTLVPGHVKSMRCSNAPDRHTWFGQRDQPLHHDGGAKPVCVCRDHRGETR